MHYRNKKQLKIWLDPYCISTILFAVWMLFGDVQNIFEQYSLYKRLKKLQLDAMHYQCQIRQIKKEKEFYHNIDSLEKLAREKYYMKREKEDVYVIVRE